MSVAPFSPEWAAAATAVLAGQAYRGPAAAVQITVSGGDDGTRVVCAVLDSAGVRYEPGPYPGGEPPASFDLLASDAEAFLAGAYAPVVGFMQGTLKVKGATRPLFELFRLWAQPEHRGALVAACQP
jgi:hypothetical protein